MEEDLLPSPLKNFTPRGNPPVEKSPPPAAEGLKTVLAIRTAEEITNDIGSLANLAIDALEEILRNPAKYSKQIIGAAKLVLDRKLGAVPDTVIQNNMQFIVKWED